MPCKSFVPLSYSPLSPRLPSRQVHLWYYRLPRCLAQKQGLPDVGGDVVDATTEARKDASGSRGDQINSSHSPTPGPEGPVGRLLEQPRALKTLMKTPIHEFVAVV